MSDDPVGQVPASADEEPRNGLEALTDEVLPALIARLRASRLGELEVRSGDWRIRLRRDVNAHHSRAVGGTTGAGGQTGTGAAELLGSVARSPAVGYFTPSPDLALGASVQAGDPLGSIDVLGIAQDVTAPDNGIVSRVLAEDGQAVEYGQALADIDPLEADLETDAADAAVAG